jgi:hypothetical protein
MSSAGALIGTPALFLRIIHRSAWKVNSQKAIFGILHKLCCWFEVGRYSLISSIDLDTTGVVLNTYSPW